MWCTYLVVQMPRHVIFRCASVLKNGPEVNFDKLPLRTVTEMAENSAQTSRGKLGQEHWGDVAKKGKETSKKKKKTQSTRPATTADTSSKKKKRKPLVNLTSWSGCPLQVPPAHHQHRVGKRWSYICPSFCLHQNSAWGERTTVGWRRDEPQIDLKWVREAGAGGADLRRLSPNMPNWQRRVSDGHQRSSLVQEEDAVLLLKDLQNGEPAFAFSIGDIMQNTYITKSEGD